MSLDQLVKMTRFLGQLQLNYVIIGEGNTSERIDGEAFWVKASGQQMSAIGPGFHVVVRHHAHLQPAR